MTDIVGKLSTVDRYGRDYDECDSSGLLTESGVIIADDSQLRGFVLLTDGTNDATIVIYDNASAASGKILFKAKVTGSENFGGIVNLKVKAVNGIYASITGTGAEFIVFYVDIK